MDMEVEGEMVTRLTSAFWVSSARPSPHQDPHPFSHGDRGPKRGRQRSQSPPLTVTKMAIIAPSPYELQTDFF